jgi:ribosomal protein S20
MHSMKSDNQILREAIRSYIKKVIRESEEEQKADAEWIVDKIATALDAATNKDKDYQYAAAFDSIKLKKLAQDIKKRQAI